jgi:hypothetical protein
MSLVAFALRFRSYSCSCPKPFSEEERTAERAEKGKVYDRTDLSSLHLRSASRSALFSHVNLPVMQVFLP